MKTKLVLLVVLLLNSFVLSASEWDKSIEPSRTITYKKIGDMELKLHVFDPPAETKKPMPAIVFFFGGGWTGGQPAQLYHQSKYLARHGVLAVSAEYRTMGNGRVQPSECVKDGKAAIRYVRKHAKELGVDPERIAAGGGSAGGHVAAAAGTVKGFEHEDEDMSVSSRPNAMVLFNPVYDNSENGYGYGRVKNYWQEFSPLHNIDKDTPPAIVFFGSNEQLVKIPAMEEFQAKMRALGLKSELKIYDGQSHGFFNHGRSGNKYFIETMAESHKFLEELGWISGKPDVEEYLSSVKPQPSIIPQPKKVEIAEGNVFPGEKTDFKGFDRYKVRTAKGTISVVCPKHAAPGKPWLWRSMFWGIKSGAVDRVTDGDLKLVEQGYYVVIAPGHVAGHPKGNAWIDAAYEMLTQEYGFSKTLSMASMSRENLALFRWASTNPEKVESIYVDNGVCNVKSWPGGKLVPGSGSIANGDPRSWEGMKKVYGFATDEELLAAQVSPIDLLEPLAKAGVPILMVCGTKDSTVPYEENGVIMKERYEKLGGSIQIITEDKGHHPHGLEDPTPVIEFIKNNRVK